MAWKAFMSGVRVLALPHEKRKQNELLLFWQLVARMDGRKDRWADVC